MAFHLPTLSSATWTVTALRDSLTATLSADTRGGELKMFFYAVTESGWRAVRPEFRRWLSRNAGRKLIAYVGTDHGITEAEAIRLMVGDGMTVNLMTNYRGVFHPKVVWLAQPAGNTVWIGSNNLTRDGLLNNIEFAAMLKSEVMPAELVRWAKEVHSGSTEFSQELLAEYELERREYGDRRAALGTFTWSRRERPPVAGTSRATRRPPTRSRLAAVNAGDLVVEVMPRETGAGGKQIQLPMQAATRFFGLADQVGASRTFRLSPAWLNDTRELTMTIFKNHTVRLAIKELDYRDRPCVLLFRRRRSGLITFDIISRSISPTRYRELLGRCAPPTRQGSRGWGIIE